MPSIGAWNLGLARPVKDGLKQETDLLGCVRASAHPRIVWSKDWSLSRSMPCPSSLSLSLSLNLTQQPSQRKIGRSEDFRQAPFTQSHLHCFDEDLHARLKIDVDGVQITSKAARFCVSSRSMVRSTGIERIRTAKDHFGRTLDSFARSWDEKYFRSSTAHSTTSAFQFFQRNWTVSEA